MNYKNKYIKYKIKYNNLVGGSQTVEEYLNTKGITDLNKNIPEEY